jgi:Spy/CpxP family protein refolding chaperone
MKPEKITALLLLGASLTVRAQTNAAPAAPTNPPPRAVPSRQIPVSRSPFDRFLDPDEQKVFHAAIQANQGKIQALNSQIRQLRMDMSELMLAGNFDEAGFRAKSEAVGKLQTEIDMLMVEAFRQVRPMLNTNQVDEIRGRPAPLPTRPATAPDSRTNTAAPPTP